MFAQGVPQGSVLSPLLFVVYFDDLVSRLSDSVQVSAFADDLAVWCTDRCVAVCNERLQGACDLVVDWCEEWMMRLAANKCSVILFSMDARDAEMDCLRVMLGGCLVARERKPCFLGVTFDSRLLFQDHVGKVVSRARLRVNLLRKLAGCAWGWSKSLMHRTYVALVRSALLFGSSARGPWLSEWLFWLSVVCLSCVGLLRCAGCSSWTNASVCLGMMRGVSGGLLVCGGV